VQFPCVLSVQCRTPNNEDFNAGETIKISPANDDYRIPQSADVVFVVENRRCNRKAARKLGEVVYQIEQSLSRSCKFSLNSILFLTTANARINSITWDSETQHVSLLMIVCKEKFISSLNHKYISITSGLYDLKVISKDHKLLYSVRHL